MRVGIFEKVEAIANQPVTPVKGGDATTVVINESGRIASSLSVTVMDNIHMKVEEVSQGSVDYNSHCGRQADVHFFIRSYKYHKKRLVQTVAEGSSGIKSTQNVTANSSKSFSNSSTTSTVISSIKEKTDNTVVNVLVHVS